MSDEMNDGVEETEEVSAKSSARTPEEYEAEIKQLRKEAAGRRVQNREKDTELDEFKAWKESQKSEIERLTDRAMQAEKNLADLQLDKLRTKAAKQAGLDLDLADRIRGDSLEEMIEDAQDLASKGLKKRTVSTASKTGEAVRGSADTSDLFNNWLHNNLS